MKKLEKMLKRAVKSEKEILDIVDDLFEGNIDTLALEEVFSVKDADRAKEKFWTSVKGFYAEVVFTGPQSASRVRLVLTTSEPHIELTIDVNGHGEIVGYWACSDPVHERVYLPALAEAAFELVAERLGYA